MKTHRSAIVLIPDRNIWEPIQRIRKEHDRQIHRWMPHITLLYPFHPPEDFEQIDPGLQRVCRLSSPFSVRLETFRYFPHGPRRFTMWLEPASAESVRQLQARLQDEFPDCDDVSRFKAGFTPHLSVGQVTGRDALQDLLTSLQNEWDTLDMQVREFHLIHREGDQPFRIARSYTLQ
jgi:2'-5' RNA ligase